MDESPKPGRWTVSVDPRDLVGGAGLLAMLGGAAVFHWGAALFVAGLGAFVFAVKLTRG